MTLKRAWFEKIRRGEKTIEYREAKPYWVSRLVPAPASIVFRNGYSAAAPSIRANVSRIELLESGRGTDLDIAAGVFAIHLTNVRDVAP